MRKQLANMVRGTIGLALCASATASAFVYENTREFVAAGDFDGDGRADSLIVDRPTGSYRIGYQFTPGTFSWAPARASGIENIAGVSVGKLVSTNRDALVVTAPDANRLNIFDAPTTNSPAPPQTVHVPSLGPNVVTAIDIGGTSNTLHHDLFVGTIYNNTNAYRYTTLRNDGTNCTTISDAAVASALARGNRVLVRTGTNEAVGVIFRGATDTFRAYSIVTGSLSQQVLQTGLASGSDYVLGQFNTSNPLRQFLFYVPGQSNLTLRTVTETTPGSFGFSGATNFGLGAAIRQVFVLPGASTSKLLVIFGNGETAAAYDFNGSSAPTQFQSFAAAAGEFLSGASVLTGNDFILLSAPIGSNSSTRFQTYGFNGTSYIAGSSGLLPSLTSLTATANVLVYQHEPFVTNAPNLLRTLSAGDWSSAFTISGGLVSVNTERFSDTTNGLKNPSPTSLGSAPALAQYGLVNQYAEPISLFSFSRASGDAVAEVSISPAPGTYKSGISVTLSNPDGVPIFYRLSVSSNWTTYSAPIQLFKNITISYYAKPATGNAKSAIRNATYEFTPSPGTLDSDNDGVPDFVEIANGTDPLGGSDADGDGFSDLDELLAGFDPNSITNHPPTNHVRVELKAAFDLAQTPRPLDGTINTMTLSATGTVLRLFDMSGSLLAFGPTTNLSLTGVTNPAAFLTNIVIDTEQRLLACATDQHFDISTISADKTLGRELIGLFPVPSVPAGLSVSNTYTGGALATEASNWVNAAQAAYASTTREQVIRSLNLYDTLVALLFEKKIGEILLSRGSTSYSNLTLFPFRSGDAPRTSITLPELLALESRMDETLPGFLLCDIYNTLNGAISNPASAFPDLKNFTRQVYRVSSSLNNGAPGTYPSPVETIREFLHTGALHSNYLAQIVPPMSLGQLSNAFTSAGTLLASVNSRPTTNIMLAVRSDSFGPTCTLLETTLGAPYTLVHPGGTQYRLLESFRLLPGTLVSVFGYTDATNALCTGSAIEVISISLDSVPATTPEDTDGDLLIDSLERALWGDLSRSGTGDADGDGRSNLQEFFDGTDATDGISRPSAAVDLSPPTVHIEKIGGGQIRLTFTWPAAYADRIRFGVLNTTTLAPSFADTLLSAVHTGGGNFEVVLPNPGTATKFYELLLTLD